MMETVLDSTSCDMGPNGARKPLVHDYYSCSGAGGFTHLSCIIKYAKQRKKQYYTDGEVEAFINPWCMSHHCRQPFRNQLSRDVV